jgi:hypothetical protein
VSAQAVLSRAAQRQQDVQSFRGEFQVSMSGAGEEFGFAGDMAYRAPDSMYMTMNMFGQRIELLMKLPDVYMYIPGEGWAYLSFDELGVDFEQFRQYLENRSIVDIEEMSNALTNVEQLDDEVIGGVAHQHFRGQLDIARLSDLPNAGLDPETLEQVEDSIEGAEFEFWVHPDTELLRRFTMDMTMAVPEAGAVNLEMSMDFLEYNGPVDIPEPPTDAEPLSLQ